MATTQQVQALYIAYFGRPADPSGLKFWTGDGTEDTTGQMDNLADLMAASPEYKAETAGKSVEAIINNFYLNLFNRNADIAGLQFFTDQITNGNANTQDIGLFIGRAALTATVAEGETNSDKDAIVSKAAAADLWTAEVEKSTINIIAYQGPDAVQAGRVFLQPVVSTATIPTEAEVTTDIQDLVNANSVTASNKLDLTVFQDLASSTADYVAVSNVTQEIQARSNFRFTSENQIVNATYGGTATYNAGDSVVDADTTDEDILNLNGVGNIAGFGTVTNIENINLGISNMTAAFTAANITGADNLTVAGSIGNGADVEFNLTGTGITNFNLSGVTGGTGANLSEIGLVMGGNGNNTIVNGDVALNETNANATVGIDVGNGDDNITSGAGADTANVGGGVNTVNLGAGINTINELGTGGTADTVINDVASTTTANVVGTGVITATATATGLTVSGDNSATTINASTSTAVVTLLGGGGSDTLTGGSAADAITGGAANDDITGGGGIDAYTQGAGSTGLFSVNDSADLDNGDVLTLATGFDIINDYETGETFATGDVGNRTIVTDNQTIAATNNYVVRGDRAGTTFTIDLAAGADVLLFSAEGANATIAASLGTNGMVLLGYGANIANIVATDFV